MSWPADLAKWYSGDSVNGETLRAELHLGKRQRLIVLSAPNFHNDITLSLLYPKPTSLSLPPHRPLSLSLSPPPPTPAPIIREFRQRHIDMRWQAWDNHVNTNDRFSVYRQFKTLACVEPYIMLNLNRYIRYALTRFRFGVSDMKVHRSRFKLYNVNELECPSCLSGVDNEVHFVLCCPAIEDLRYEFIESKYLNNPCEFRLALLLATQNERALKNLALFLYKAFRMKTLLS